MVELGKTRGFSHVFIAIVLVSLLYIGYYTFVKHFDAFVINVIGSNCVISDVNCNIEKPGSLIRSVKESLSALSRNFGLRVTENNSDKIITDTELEDLYFAVKTSRKFHKTRIKVLIETWISLLPNQTYIFTDSEDKQISSFLPEGHLINTKCPRSYHPSAAAKMVTERIRTGILSDSLRLRQQSLVSPMFAIEVVFVNDAMVEERDRFIYRRKPGAPGFRSALACKMAKEIELFLNSGKRWFIHVDDDNYINVKLLVQTLQQFNDSMPWYIGNPSLPHMKTLKKKIKFWFATTGAGVCLSRPLVEMMNSTMGKGGFLGVAKTLGEPDDTTLGYIINYLLKVNLTKIDSFHFHYQKLAKIQHPLNQTILSYSKNNTVTIDGFSIKEDPTRYKSVHCHLYPHLEQCAKMFKKEQKEKTS